MKSAESVHGEIYKALGIFMLAAIGYMLSLYIPTGTLSRLVNIRTIPCLGLGILSGPIYIFWIATARDLFGRGSGTLVAILTVSFILLTGPWYGITNPVYFGLFGFVSFLLMGLATDFINGGVGSVACLIVNWVAFGIFRGIYPHPLLLGLAVLILSFISGYAFDYASKIIFKRMMKMSQ